MSSLRQIQANRLNARLSTGPVTEEGKKRSRQNAVRHGLTAETVIGSLEDAEDYAAFELAVTSDYDAQTAVERELVLRLASLLWRLRRATAIETGLFEMQALELFKASKRRPMHQREGEVISNINPYVHIDEIAPGCPNQETAGSTSNLTQSFVLVNNLPTCPLDRLNRYENALWRQAVQILFTLHHLNRKLSRRNGL